MTTVTNFLRRNRTGSAAVLSAALFFALGFSATSVSAQSVATVPVGAVTVSIAAGTGSARTLTPVSFPLLTSKVASGNVTGRIASVTANTISDSSAGWTAGALSTAATPTLIQVTSGTAAGRTFLVSTSVANSATTVTVSAEDGAAVDISTLGIVTGVSGDTYRLLECDTLASIFADTGVQGATSITNADVVQILVGGSFAQYYYNTTSAAWLKVALGSPNSNNLPLRPESVILYNRIAAAPLTLTLTGDVPNVKRVPLIANSGVTVLSTHWPVDRQLGSLGIEAAPGWVASSSSATADLVSVFVGGAWAQYFYNGTSWRKVALGSPASDTLVIPVGSGVLINKRGAVSGSASISQTVPYSL